ncbi:MAG: response regulator transcription factor [Candidatus Helarchaeota archaeon]
METQVKILVVDDEPDTVLLASRLLELDGYKVIHAYDGEEALRKIYREKPDIVILDILLPKKDGFVVCKEIKSDRMIAGTIVIILTVKIFDDDRKRGFEAGADYYLTKPYSGDELRKLIRDVLEKKQIALESLT